MAKPLFNVKKMFFDSEKIVSAMDRSKRRALSAQGAFIRRAAKSSIRQRKQPSRPGQPPSSHTGLLRGFIFFAFDPGMQSAVIGPEKLNSISGYNYAKPMYGAVPEILEHGGMFFVDEVLFDPATFYRGKHKGIDLSRWDHPYGWRRVDNRIMSGRYGGMKRRARRVVIKPRPFMGPAMEKGNADFARKFKDSLK